MFQKKRGMIYAPAPPDTNFPSLALIEKEYHEDPNIRVVAEQVGRLSINWPIVIGSQAAQKVSFNSGATVSGNCFISGAFFFMGAINSGYDCNLVTATFNHDEVIGTDTPYKTHHCFIVKTYQKQKYVINVSNLHSDYMKIYKLRTYMEGNNFSQNDYIQSFTHSQFKRKLNETLPNALDIIANADLDTAMDVYQFGIKPILNKTMQVLSDYEGW